MSLMLQIGRPTSGKMVQRPKKDVTFLLDCSGSMAPLRYTVMRAFNKMLGEQRQNPDAVFSLCLFGTRFDAGKPEPISQSTALTADSYDPHQNGTALLDGIGNTVRVVERRVTPATRPTVVIITDGRENASERFTWEMCARLIAAKMVEGWTFILLAANQDAQSTASKLGIPIENAMTFSFSALGMKRAFGALSENLITDSAKFKDAQRAEQRWLLSERNP